MAEKLTITKDCLEKIAKECGQAHSALDWCCNMLRHDGKCNVNSCEIHRLVPHTCPLGVFNITK